MKIKKAGIRPVRPSECDPADAFHISFGSFRQVEFGIIAKDIEVLLNKLKRTGNAGVEPSVKSFNISKLADNKRKRNKSESGKIFFHLDLRK
jgi:hypothetical protein